MLTTNPTRDLFDEQDLSYQRREWALERFGWLAFSIVLIAALAGMLGRGPLSSRTATSESGTLSVRYDRFVRRCSATELTFVLTGLGKSETVRLWIDRQYLDAVGIESIVPRPAHEELDSDGAAFVFSSPSDNQGGNICFRLEPVAPGPISATIRLDGGGEVIIRQLVYP